MRDDLATFLMFVLAAGADDKHPLGAQVNGRGNGGQLAHRSVAEKLAMNLSGREYERNGAGGEQVVDADFRTDADALYAVPGLGIGTPLKEIDVVAGFVTGCRNAQGVQRAIGDRALDAAEIEVATEQFT